MASRFSWVDELSANRLCISVDVGIYSAEALFRVCYLFTDRCYLFLANEERSKIIKVHFATKTPNADLSTIAAEFCNELINQKVRLEVAEETRAIRELIVAQAFTEADLLNAFESRSDYISDPKGIAR